jgi:hypothetical protein
MSRRPALVFFLVVTVGYLALSPFSVGRMGYTPEQVEGARGIIATAGHALRGDFTTRALSWPRHGLLEPLILTPFVITGQTLFGAHSSGEDVILSIQPVLFTACLCTIAFLWMREVVSITLSAVLSFAAAFATILWPYAYIGLETTQSLALALAAWLALRTGVTGTWRETLLFTVAAAVAVSVKANGFMLLPAVLYLIAQRWRQTRSTAATSLTIAFVAAVFVFNQYCRDVAPSRSAGSTVLFNLYRADGTLSVLLNFVYLFVSVNKGLLIYCPIVVLAFASLRRAWAVDRRIVIFALLSTLGLAAGSAVFVFWADDTWGPRYLHSVVVPLVVTLAIARRNAPLRLRAEAPLIATVAVGFVLAVLGVLFYYGTASLAANAASQRSIENIQHDPEWNPPRLHAVLLKVWLRGPEAGPAPWPPVRHRWFPAPAESFDFQPTPVIDLRQFAEPQPYMLRFTR